MHGRGVLGHRGGACVLEPLSPDEVGFAGVVCEVPPPSFFEDLFDEDAVIAFFDVGFKYSFFIMHRNMIRSIHNIPELIPYFSKTLHSLLSCHLLDWQEVFELDLE